MVEVVLGPYQEEPVRLRASEPTSPARAAALIAHTAGALAPGEPLEHIGSTAVPGLPGKGVIDLATHLGPDRIGPVAEAAVALGWQRQTEPWAHPPERPMLYATATIDGDVVRSHFHLLPTDGWEWGAVIAFRDLLRADPTARARYIARKREVLAAGVDVGHEYAEAKSGVVRDLLAEVGVIEPTGRT